MLEFSFIRSVCKYCNVLCVYQPCRNVNKLGRMMCRTFNTLADYVKKKKTSKDFQLLSSGSIFFGFTLGCCKSIQ